jgi:hypothetical protein
VDNVNIVRLVKPLMVLCANLALKDLVAICEFVTLTIGHLGL